ncbi:hypothetical protein K458DRAFT_473629 [Lentithecium fluviatile CBS 122367]|uniref:Metallo-dependent phosphatase n=1 Tax=Lentithecium fluviatile CBS 122367 TaxID=1168545 RepID=A0A6G1JPE6_9PLEO|nr:hypothetical protein K458DRAFT_473629 [Lentithecium fluviatile CBS 122367]
MTSFRPLRRSQSPSSQPAGDYASKRSRLEVNTTTNETASVKFLVHSDTRDAELAATLPQCDVLLHCGDLTEDGSPASLEKVGKAIGKAKAELKLVLAGGSGKDHLEARALISLNEDSEASKNGIIFLDEGTHTFTLKSGSTFNIYASPYTPKYGSSAFQYPVGQNVGTEKSVIPNGVDVVMTHGPPKYILDTITNGRIAGCEHLRRAIACVQPRLHCFGHVHRGYGAQRIEYDGTRTLEGDPDFVSSLPKEWVGKNQAKRKGYASLPPNSAEAFRENKGHTLWLMLRLWMRRMSLGVLLDLSIWIYP